MWLEMGAMIVTVTHQVAQILGPQIEIKWGLYAGQAGSV